MKLISSPFSTMLIIVFAFIITSCATTYSFERERPDAMAEYLSKPSEKALAIFMISNNNYGYGYGDNYDTVEGAKERAMSECLMRQQEYDNVDQPCKIYMVNAQKVSEKESGGGN